MKAPVLYAPRNISGQASEYAAGVEPYGYQGEVWSYGPPAFGFSADRVVDKDRWVVDRTHRWELLDEAVRRFGIFHFQYARSLVIARDQDSPELWDLPLLKSLDKKVFMHFRGSDVRLRSQHLRREPDSYLRGVDAAVDEDTILGRVAICRRFCDGLFVSTPGLLDYVPDATWIPHAVDPDAWDCARGPERRVPLVLHVPSRRGTKSSDQVDAALTRAAAQGVCEYRSLHGLSRAELKAAMQRADIVVDSLGIGDHGLISVEAMAAGAIAVAHIHPRNRERNPGVPVVEATAADLGDVVRRLAEDPSGRAELRERGRDWVRTHHSRKAVGATLADFYDRPVRRPTLSYPDWPRAETRERVLELERALEREWARQRRTFARRGWWWLAELDPPRRRLWRLVRRGAGSSRLLRRGYGYARARLERARTAAGRSRRKATDA